MGWYDNADYTKGTQYYDVNGASTRTWNKVANTTLYAGWSAATYTIRYNFNLKNATGTSSVEPITATCTYDAECTIAANTWTADTADLGGHREFTGWNTTSTGDGTTYQPGAQVKNLTTAGGTIDLYGIWGTCAECTDNGVNCTISAPVGVCTYVTSCKTGYENLVNGATANASCGAIVYPITYNLDGGTNASGAPTSYTIETATITLGTPTKTGYTFDGWYTESAFTNQVTQIAIGSTGAKAFWAKWTPITYTITYNLNGGTNVNSAPTSYTIDAATIALGTPTRAHSAFGGWYTESTFENQVTQIATGTTGDKVFWARWTCDAGYSENTGNTACVANTYQITFNANGGIGGPATATATYDARMDKLTTLPTRDTYSFTGYFDDQDAGVQYYASDGTALRSWDKTSNATLYAHWSQNRIACELGKYYDGTNQVECPSGKYCPGTGDAAEGGAGCAIECTTLGDDYTSSDAGATSAEQCWKPGTKACRDPGKNTECPSTTLRCTYDSDPENTIECMQYYNGDCVVPTGVDDKCPILPSSLACKANYYVNSELGECSACTNLGSFNDPDTGNMLWWNESTGGRLKDGATVCYNQSGMYDCTEDVKKLTPEHATCEPLYEKINGIRRWPETVCTEGYNASCAATNCSCEAGYTFRMPSGQKNDIGSCDPNTYNIVIDDNNGTGGTGTIYELFATGFYADADVQNQVTSVAVPVRANYTFLGYFTDPTGGDMVVSQAGTILTDATFTAATTWYAHWEQNVIECPGAGKYINADDQVADCPAGSWCPGRGSNGIDVVPAGNGGGCNIACPAAPNNAQTSPAGASEQTACYYIADPWSSFQNGTAAAQCNYHVASGTYGNCSVKEVHTCVAGHYYTNRGETLCVPTDDGYWSAADSTTQTKCPDYREASDNIVHSESTAERVTQCWKYCDLKPSDVSHSQTVTSTNENGRVYATDTNVYAQCTYNVTCDTGYDATNGAVPSCNGHVYTITLDKNGGNGDIVASAQCTFDSGACTLPATDALTRAGYSVGAQWCTTASGGAPCYTGGETITPNISADGTDTKLYAIWTPNVYRVNLVQNDATTAPTPASVYLKYATGWFRDAAATNAIVRLDTVPTKTGYEFAGYFTDSLMIVANDGTFETGVDALTMTTNQDATINVKWSAGRTTCPAGQYYTGTGTTCAPCNANSETKQYYCPGGSFGTDSGVIAGRNTCPNGGLVASDDASSISDCYLDGLTTYPANHGRGTQTCNYNSDTQVYDSNCRNRAITWCDAGYYLDAENAANQTSPDCVMAIDGHYSLYGLTTQNECPGYTDGGLVHSDGDRKSSGDCYRELVLLLGEHGSGTQTCHYTTGDGDSAQYSTECTDKVITKCAAGYWRVAASDTDCAAIGQGYYSGADELARHECPTENGMRGTTVSNVANEIGLCYLAEKPYTADHGHGTKRCDYNTESAAYTNCGNAIMTVCDGGYWYNSVTEPNDCIAVGIGFWSANDVTTRVQCIGDGTTTTETSTSAYDCYKDGVACPITNGRGENTCHLDGTTNEYTADCTECVVTACDTGFDRVGNTCVNCPENNVCANGEQKTCTELTSGEYTMADAGTTDVGRCYRDCANAEHATAMRGRDYHDGSNTCEITACAAGWTLSDGECVPCPNGHYCDGVATAPIACPADWPLADAGSTSQNACHRMCESYSIIGGTANPVQPTVFWPAQCEFTGTSDSGNPCDIVDGKCRETSCNSDYEMDDGVCVPCNRDHALGYQDTGNCFVSLCELGYHPNDKSCEENVQVCTAPNAVSATMTWNPATKSFGPCTITECDGGFHVASNACVSDVQPCSVENGTGTKEWNHATNKWDACIADTCEPGYTTDPSEQDPRYTTQNGCGVCANKYAEDGEIAASTYVRGCEIASCMYQGEKYNLDGNHCELICSVTGYSDETGTMKWDNARKKCVRTCEPGYTAW